MKPEKTTSEDSALIDKLGGTGGVAKMFDIKAPSVSSWRKKGIPKPRLMYLKAVFPLMFVAEDGSVRQKHQC